MNSVFQPWNHELADELACFFQRRNLFPKKIFHAQFYFHYSFGFSFLRFDSFSVFHSGYSYFGLAFRFSVNFLGHYYIMSEIEWLCMWFGLLIYIWSNPVGQIQRPTKQSYETDLPQSLLGHFYFCLLRIKRTTARKCIMEI